MIAEWIKSVLICTILFSVVLYIAPNPRMRRYVQMAVGFVMIIVVLQPVLSAMKCEDRLTFNLYEESLGSYVADSDNSVYLEAMEQVVEAYIRDSWGLESDVTISLTAQFNIESMTILIEDTKHPPGLTMVAEMTRCLAREYSLDAAQIVIN